MATSMSPVSAKSRSSTALAPSSSATPASKNSALERKIENNADAEDGVRKCGTPGCTLAAGHIGLCESECTSGKRRHSTPSADPPTPHALPLERKSERNAAAAALCSSRHVGAERAAAEVAEARGKGPLTADAARAAAAAEGLELLLSSSSETGFKGVTKNHEKYAAKIRENGKQRSLGNFVTPEEAALCYARFVKEGGGVTEAAEARGDAEAVDGVRRGRDRGWENADAEDGVRKCGTPGCTLAAGHIGLCDSECTSGKRRHSAPSAECTSGKRRHRAHDSAPSAEGTRGKRRHSAPSAVPRQPRPRS